METKQGKVFKIVVVTEEKPKSTPKPRTHKAPVKKTTTKKKK